MRIVLVNSQDMGGGAAGFTRQLGSGLIARGHDVTLLVGIKKTNFPWVKEVPVFGTGTGLEMLLQLMVRGAGGSSMTEARNRQLSRRLLHFREWRGVMARRGGFEDYRLPGTQKILSELGGIPDVVHLNNLHYFVGPTHFDTGALKRLSPRTRIVYTLHDTWAFTGHCVYFFECQRWKQNCGSCPHLDVYVSLKKDQSAANLRTKAALYREIGVTLTTPSNWLMNAAKSSVLAPAIRHSKVIPYGIDLEFFKPAEDREAVRKALGIGAHERVICFVADNGRTTPWRDYDFVEKLALAYGERNSQAALLVIEVGSEARDETVGNVRFVGTGRLDAAGVRRVFQAGDLMVYPAKVDNFPYVILEALACGTPVLASRVGGIPEEFEEGKNGELFSPGDLETALNHLTGLLGNVPRLELMRREARAQALRAYQMERMIDDYERLYLSGMRENDASSHQSAGNRPDQL